MTLLVAMLTAGMAVAYDFEVDGIYYFTAGNMAVVTYGDGYNSYHGYVTIPANVTHDGTTYQVMAIGSHAFDDCSDLTGVDIPATVTTIGQNAFYRCTALKGVVIPNSVTNIDNYAFGFCSALSSVSLGSSLTSIGESAFSYCESLTGIVIPSTVKTIVGNPFYRCTALSLLEVEGGNTAYDSRNHCNAIIETETGTLLAGCRTTVVPEGVDTIADHSFSFQTGLTHIDLPNSLREIGKYAFQGCSGLQSVTFGSGVESINYYAFAGCTSLQEVDFPDALKTLGNNAFEGCSALTRVSTGDGLTSIGNDAFSSCAALDSVAFGKSIQIIHNNAFMSSASLRSAILPDGLTTIGWFAFAGSGISHLYLGKNLSGGIGEHAFEWCTNLTSVTVPEGVVNLNIDMFSHCSSLAHVSLPSTLKTIGSRAFSQCEALKEITIPDGVTTIYNRAFFRCTGLTTIVIPDSVTDLNDEVFVKCTGLTQVTIGKSVRWLESGTFTGCQALSTVYCKAEEPPIIIDESAFARYSDAVLYVPTESVQLYKNAMNWENFGLIIGMDFDDAGGEDDYEYVPFVREGVKWVYYYDNVLGPSILDMPDGIQYYSFEMLSDVQIGDKYYKPVRLTHYIDQTDEEGEVEDFIPVYLREENKVVYAIQPDGIQQPKCPVGIYQCIDYPDQGLPLTTTNEEFVLYDFNDLKGFYDTVFEEVNYFLESEGYGPFVDYVKTDTVTLGNHQAKCHYFNCIYSAENKIIEGVGYDGYVGMPLFYFERLNTGFQVRYRLSHVIENGEIIYKGIHFRPSVPGDVDGDGETTISDANSVIEVIIHGGSGGGHSRIPIADVNCDGEVNIADVNAIFDIILRAE